MAAAEQRRFSQSQNSSKNEEPSREATAPFSIT
jgi:hypothetical protein